MTTLIHVCLRSSGQQELSLNCDVIRSLESLHVFAPRNNNINNILRTHTHARTHSSILQGRMQFNEPITLNVRKQKPDHFKALQQQVMRSATKHDTLMIPATNCELVWKQLLEPLCSPCVLLRAKATRYVAMRHLRDTLPGSSGCSPSRSRACSWPSGAPALGFTEWKGETFTRSDALCRGRGFALPLFFWGEEAVKS